MLSIPNNIQSQLNSSNHLRYKIISMISEKQKLLQSLLTDSNLKDDHRNIISFNECSDFPFNSVGWIQFRGKLPDTSKTFANGFLVAQNLVLTSSHPFFSHDAKSGEIKQCMPISFNVYSADRSGNRPEPKSYKVQSVKVNGEFTDRFRSVAVLAYRIRHEDDKKLKSQYNDQMENLNSQMILHDFALLKLSEPVARPQYFELFSGLTSKMSITVAGFAHSDGLPELVRFSIAYSINCGAILYNNDSRQQSGSAVYIEGYKGGSMKIVGIHQGRYADKDLSHASMITESMIGKLALWAQEMNKPFPTFRKESESQSKTSFSFAGWFSNLFGLGKCLKPNPDDKNQRATVLNPQSLENQQSSISQQFEEEEYEALDKADELNSRGIQLYHQCQFDKALEYYDQSLIIYEQVVGKQSADYSDTLNNIGNVYVKKSQLNQALKYYSRALSIKQKLKGKQQFDYADTLNNIGLVYYNQDKLNLALENYMTALVIYERIEGKDSLSCADVLNNIGVVYGKQRKLNQALEYYNRALFIYEKIEGKESFAHADTLTNIGNIYGKKNEINQALEYYYRALTIKQRVKGKKSFECAETINNIGAAYGKQGKMEQALEQYQRALAIKEKFKGKESIENTNSLNNIGFIYKKQTKFNKALQYYGRSLTIYQKAGATKSLSYAKTLKKISDVYQSLNQHQQANNFFAKSKAIKRDLQMI